MGLSALLILFVFFPTAAMAKMACKDYAGKDVPWSVTYKLPKLDPKVAPNEQAKAGLAFFYADANRENPELSKTGVDDPNSPLGRTVSQAIIAHQRKLKDTMTIFYNDQPPYDNANGKKPSGGFAHAKGVLSFSRTECQGFWIIHSAPQNYSPKEKKYTYSNNARNNGQTFFCGTFKVTQLPAILKHLKLMRVYVFDSFIPPLFTQSFPMATEVAAGEMQAVEFSPAPLKLTGSPMAITHYGKSAKWNGDLYLGVANARQTSLFVETWLNGVIPFKNVCDGKATVKNLRTIAPGGIEWESSKDHSKWAVTDQGQTVVCIGDINRHRKQEERGGGTMCLENKVLWDFFRKAVKVAECCPKDKAATECRAMPDKSIDTPKGAT